MRTFSTLLLTAGLALSSLTVSAAVSSADHSSESLQTAYNQQFTPNTLLAQTTVGQTISIAATDLDVYLDPHGYDGYYTAIATNADYEEIRVLLYPTAGAASAYTTYVDQAVAIALTKVAPGSPEEKPTIVAAQMVLSRVDESDRLTGYVETDGGIRYEFDLRYELPTATETIRIVANNIAFDYDLAEWLMYGVTASNAEYEVSFLLYGSSESIYGSYAAEDFTLELGPVGEELAELDLSDGQIEVGKDAAGDYLRGYALTSAGIRYEFELGLSFPDPERTIPLAFAQAALETGVGLFQFTGTDLFPEAGLPAPYDAIRLAIAVRSETVAGTYTSEDIVEEGTGLYYVNSAAPKSEEAVQATVDAIRVTEDVEAGTYTLTAEVRTTDAILYEVRMTAPIPGDELQYDAREGEVNRIYTPEDAMTIVFDDLDNSLYFRVSGQSESGAADRVGLRFFVAAQDPRIGIPAGTYPINDTGDVGSVLASEGVDEEDNVTYSFYGTLTEEGNLTMPIYFLVSGTVLVAETDGALTVTVDARNSYDLPVRITYRGVPTALPLPEAEPSAAQKRITPEGHLRILRGGHTYDATGARVE